MKLNLKNNNEFVGIAIGTNYINLSVIRKQNNNYTLDAFEEFIVENSEIINLYIFNYLKLKNIISEFFSKYKLNRGKLVVCFEGPNIYQNIVPELTENIKNEISSYRLQVENLSVNGNNLYFIGGIRPDLLLQYKLFAINYRLKIISITTEARAWYYAQQAINAKPVPTIDSVEKFKFFLKNNITEKIDKQDDNFLTALGLYRIGLKVYENG